MKEAHRFDPLNAESIKALMSKKPELFQQSYEDISSL
jgi:hypothetical protein